MSPGKQFEHSFQSSVPSTVFIYRFRDNAASFSQTSSTRFASSNICDYLIIDDISKTAYLLELKTVKGASIPLSNIRTNQIKELTKASSHNLVAGFIINFREKNNYTAFLSIQNFNEMLKELGKKSFNIEDMKRFGCIEIQSIKKKVHYKYNVEQFIKDTSV